MEILQTAAKYLATHAEEVVVLATIIASVFFTLTLSSYLYRTIRRTYRRRKGKMNARYRPTVMKRMLIYTLTKEIESAVNDGRMSTRDALVWYRKSADALDLPDFFPEKYKQAKKQQNAFKARMLERLKKVVEKKEKKPEIPGELPPQVVQASPPEKKNNRNLKVV